MIRASFDLDTKQNSTAWLRHGVCYGGEWHFVDDIVSGYQSAAMLYAKFLFLSAVLVTIWDMISQQLNSAKYTQKALELLIFGMCTIDKVVSAEKGMYLTKD